MEQDIRKLAVWIEKATREQIAVERQLLELKRAEKASPRDSTALKER